MLAAQRLPKGQYIGVEKRKGMRVSCNHTMERGCASGQKNQRIIRWRVRMNRMMLEDGKAEQSRVGRRRLRVAGNKGRKARVYFLLLRHDSTDLKYYCVCKSQIFSRIIVLENYCPLPEYTVVPTPAKVTRLQTIAESCRSCSLSLYELSRRIHNNKYSSNVSGTSRPTKRSLTSSRKPRRKVAIWDFQSQSRIAI
jgi:hypothetical protein